MLGVLPGSKILSVLFIKLLLCMSALHFICPAGLYLLLEEQRHVHGSNHRSVPRIRVGWVVWSELSPQLKIISKTNL